MILDLPIAKEVTFVQPNRIEWHAESAQLTERTAEVGGAETASEPPTAVERSDAPMVDHSFPEEHLTAWNSAADHLFGGLTAKKLLGTIQPKEARELEWLKRERRRLLAPRTAADVMRSMREKQKLAELKAVLTEYFDLLEEHAPVHTPKSRSKVL